MSVDGTPEPTPAAPRRSRRVMHVCISAPAALLVVYLMSAYVFIPMAWSSYAWRHPAVDDAPRITRTGNGIPGDPLNIALIGTEDAIGRAMIEAGWRPADPITLKTCLRITHSTLLKRPYEQAPVSNLYLYGRKQDLAFQRAVGDNPRQRHHVRFWCAAELDDAGRPLWFGAATYDTSVGVSHTTGQITHHIHPEVDAERDKLLRDLHERGQVDEIIWIDDFHVHKHGKNGGGDHYHTDGRLPMAVIALRTE